MAAPVHFTHWLLPQGLVVHSEARLTQTRVLVLLVFLSGLGFFVYLLYWMMFSGRIEVWDTQYKVDRIEAPSVVVCPFEPGTAVLRGAEPAVTVVLYTDQGPRTLPVKPRACRYDRDCVCVDLFALEDPRNPGRSPQLRDHSHDATRFLGTQGDRSELEQDFQDRLELRTTLYDPSPDRTLKLGLYDSADHTPHWSYTQVGGYTIGQLLLDKWFVMDLSFEAFGKFFAGDFGALSHVRHIFRCFAQEVRHNPGTEAQLAAAGLAAAGPRTRSVGETRLSLEMQTFFVSQTIASETALSMYSMAVVVLLMMLRGPVVRAFFNAVFPTQKPADDPPRELSGAVERFLDSCCCGRWACWGRGEAALPEEEERLLGTPGAR